MGRRGRVGVREDSNPSPPPRVWGPVLGAALVHPGPATSALPPLVVSICQPGKGDVNLICLLKAGETGQVTPHGIAAGGWQSEEKTPGLLTLGPLLP